jgi:ankyrin repeat protein
LTLNEEFVNSALTRLVISSTINNFSGLDGIPHSILECLQNPTNMRLLQDLQSANGPEVAAFAEKLFLAAVESSNAGIVEYLLRMNALDPNKLVCNHKGFRYTPIERAVELDSMEVTRVLIHARVDLKKTLERTYGDNRGALETALMIKIPRRYQIRFVNIELVRMLLDAGAVLDPKRLDMDSFCYWDEMDFLLLVTSFHYSASATRHIVKDILVGILRVAVESFKKTDALKYWDLAWSAIVGMAKTDFAKAINFLSQEPEIREFTLNMAAEQGHLELVKALLGSGTIPTAVYLCRGIRSGDEELVRYLLDAGADASGHCSTPAVTNGDLKDGARLLPCWFFPLRSLHPYTTPFAEAIRLGNVQILGILQSRGSWLKIEEKFRFSAALTAAVGVGDIRFARELLDIHSAHELLDMEPILDGEGWLDILLSAVLGNQEEIVMMILDNKAAAIRSKVVEIVWSYECQSRRREFEFEESSIQKALSHASGTGQTSIVRKLLGLSTVFSGRYLSSSLLASIQGNHEQVALMLLDAGANPSSECVGAALSVKNFELVNALLEADAIFEDKPCRHLSQYYLHPLLVLEATKLGDYSILERIVAHGADVDVFYPEPATALTVAVEKQDIRLVQLLLDSGADINLCARYPRVVVTPLAAAVLQGNVTMTGLLLARGANPANAEALYTGLLRNDLITEKLLQAFAKKHPHGKKGFGFEVMARAIKLGNLDIIRQLLLLPVDLGCWTETRKFPRGYLDGLPDQGWITTLGWAIIKDKGKHLDIVQMILEAGDDPNANAFKQYVDCTVFKKTALLVAVDTGNLEIVRLLVGHGAMVNCLTTMGVKRTPLQTAAEIGSFDIAECLLSKGAEINAPPARSGGATSLQLAAIGGYIGIAELLLKLGADPNAPAAKVNGRTAIEGAAEFGRIDMLRLLTNAGAKMDWRQFEIAAWLAEKNGHIATKKYLGAIFHETVSVEELLSQ